MLPFGRGAGSTIKWSVASHFLIKFKAFAFELHVRVTCIYASFGPVNIKECEACLLCLVFCMQSVDTQFGIHRHTVGICFGKWYILDLDYISRIWMRLIGFIFSKVPKYHSAYSLTIEAAFESITMK